MSRPFDEARYKGLLEGLEITAMLLSEVRRENDKLRIDSGYFAKPMLKAETLVRNYPSGHDELGPLFSRFVKGVFDINAESYADSGIPFLRILNLRGGVIDDSDLALIPESVHETEKKTELRRGDIVLSKTAYPAASLVTLEHCNTSQDTIATTLSKYGRETYSPEAIVAYLNSPTGQRLLWRQFQGNVQLHLSLDDGRKVPVPRLGRAIQAEIKAAFTHANNSRKLAADAFENASLALLQTLKIESWQPPEPLSYTRNTADTFAAGRLDAEFFQPRYHTLQDEVGQNFELQSLCSLGLVTKGVTVPYSEDGTIPIIRSGDLSDIENGKDFLRANVAESIFYLERGDILISSIGFGSIGKVQVFDKPEPHGTVSEVTVIRQKKINPYYLAAFLRSIAGQMQIEHHITGATGQLHLYPKDVANFWIPILPLERQEEFERFAKQYREQRNEASRLLEAAKRAVEIAIEDSEAAALVYLEAATTEY